MTKIRLPEKKTPWHNSGREGTWSVNKTVDIFITVQQRRFSQRPWCLKWTVAGDQMGKKDWIWAHSECTHHSRSAFSGTSPRQQIKVAIISPWNFLQDGGTNTFRTTGDWVALNFLSRTRPVSHRRAPPISTGIKASAQVHSHLTSGCALPSLYTDKTYSNSYTRYIPQADRGVSVPRSRCTSQNKWKWRYSNPCKDSYTSNQTITWGISL